jgi:hypothetical protein
VTEPFVKEERVPDGLRTIRYRRFYHEQWLEDGDLFAVVCGKRVLVGDLLDAIPDDMLREAVTRLEAAGKVVM